MTIKNLFAHSATGLGAVVGNAVVGNASERCKPTVTLRGVTHYNITLRGATHYNVTLGSATHYVRAAMMLLMMLLTATTATTSTTPPPLTSRLSPSAATSS